MTGFDLAPTHRPHQPTGTHPGVPSPSPSPSRTRTAPRLSLLLLRLLVPALLLLAAAVPQAPAEVLTGIDVLEASKFVPLRGKRVGLIANPSSINRRGQPTWRLLHAAPGVKLVALFGAEHGFDGQAKAGVEVPDRTELSTGLPIYSLYGPGRTRKPLPRMLEGIDVLLYDLQDTGCRSYTFISTLGLAMEACGQAGIGFTVLDRPNPLGGIRVEGPALDPKFKSFVGFWPIPYAYGLTPGELARMIEGQRWTTNRCQVNVVAMKGWTRNMTWNDTGLRWVPTSPNVPFGQTPLHLVATGILGEIGGLNLGTGSAHSFQIISAPWLDAHRFAQRMNRYRLPGLVFEPIKLDANRNPRDGAELGATRLRITRPDTAPLAAVAFHALEAVRQVAGKDLFQLAVQRGKGWEMFDKVTGSDRTRLALQAHRSARDIVASWEPDSNAFRQQRRKYLLYPEPPASTRPGIRTPPRAPSPKPTR